MIVTEVTFSITRTINLGDYENVKPSASAKVQIEADSRTPEGQKLIADAYDAAQTACFEQLIKFRKAWDDANESLQ